MDKSLFGHFGIEGRKPWFSNFFKTDSLTTWLAWTAALCRVIDGQRHPAGRSGVDPAADHAEQVRSDCDLVAGNGNHRQDVRQVRSATVCETLLRCAGGQVDNKDIFGSHAHDNRFGARRATRPKWRFAMSVSRLAKIVMVLGLSAFAFMVTFNNITDYDSNFEFVKHVLSMDTTFPGNKGMYRAITNPTLWTLGYWGIILGEGLTCVLLLIGGIEMRRALGRSPQEFDASKRFVIAGATLGFLVWFFGFMVVGGEWFLMWQSGTWNGQTAAFQFYMSMLAVLIFVNQPERA